MIARFTARVLRALAWLAYHPLHELLLAASAPLERVAARLAPPPAPHPSSDPTEFALEVIAEMERLRELRSMPEVVDLSDFRARKGR